MGTLLLYPAPTIRSQVLPTCAGTEPYRLRVQVSLDGGSTWLNDTGSICVAGGATVDFAVRTLMTVTTGQTQGWSFGLRHTATWTQYYGGSVSVTSVTTTGTNTATVQAGAPPDSNNTTIRAGGYTQGVVIDLDEGITLGPTTDFVTSKACYRIVAPLTTGTHPISLQFTHDIGTVPVRSVVTQQGLSNTPCAKNFTLNLQIGGCYPQVYPPCTIGGFGPSGPEFGGEPTGGEGGGPLGPLPPGSPGTDFKRSDSNGDGSFDLSDAVFTLNFLFQSGPAPGCIDAADANDEELVDLSDPIWTLSHLFLGGQPPPPPYPNCGPDLTGSLTPALDLNCQTYSACNQNDADGDGLTDAYEAQIGTSSTTTDTWGRDIRCCTVELQCVNGIPECPVEPCGPGLCDFLCKGFDGIPDRDCIPDGRDTDRDGFTDAEEVLPTGVDGEINLKLLGANPLKPDIFVEIDWFSSANHNHKPLPGVLQIVEEAFDSALFEIEINGTIVTTGITIHLDTGELGGGNAITEQTYLVPNSKQCPTWCDGVDLCPAFREIEDIKADPARGYFFPVLNPPEKANRGKVFYYCLFIHEAVEDIPGGDQPGLFIVSL